jgi:hypothetical protein
MQTNGLNGYDGKAYDTVIDALRALNLKVRANSHKAEAQCPAHDDSDPSLTVTRSKNKVLVHCHGHCTQEAVIAALGLTKGDLWDYPKTSWDYNDANGQRHRTVYRTHENGKRKIWQDIAIDDCILLDVPEVTQAVQRRELVYLVEGESDYDTLKTLGVTVTTAPQGADSFHKVDIFPLINADIIAIPDQDDAGIGWGKQVFDKLDGYAHSLTFKAAAVGKDVSDHIAAGKKLHELQPLPPPGPALNSRWVNLDQFLDGTYTPPQPDLGAIRDDGTQFLYRGRWHTLIALTTAGKTTFALWQVKSVLEWGGHVVYIHFEEASPSGIIHRLTGLGVNIEAIRKRFHWGHVDTPWKWGELAAEIEQLDEPPQLAVLDGINAACGMHNWPVKEPESVGSYRVMFVHPLTKAGAAVLSLGHPPKAANRQSESYSYGAAGWLNDVDGVGYRMTASKTPISKGVKGSSALYVVKDRYGEVQRWGELQSGDGMPWWYMGQFVVDDARPEDTAGILAETNCHVTVPARNEEGAGKDKIDALCDHILIHLRETTGRFETVNKLKDALRAKGVHVRDSDVAPALLRLAGRELIEWPEVLDRRPRPGWLINIEEG